MKFDESKSLRKKQNEKRLSLSDDENDKELMSLMGQNSSTYRSF